MSNLSLVISNARSIAQGRFFKNSFWAILDQFLGLFLSLFITVVLARYFGASELGKYTLAVALASLVSVITNLGLQSPVKREVAKDSSQTGLYLGQSLIIRWFLSLPLSIVLIHLSGLTLGYDYQMMVFCHLINVFIFLSGLFSLNSGVLISLHLNKKVLIYNVIYRVFLLVSLFGVIQAELTLIEYAYGLILVTFCVFCFSSIFVVRYTQKLVLRLDFAFSKRLLLTSLPLALAAAVEFANLKIDSLILGAFHTSADVGYYAAGFNILMAFIAVPMAVTKVFFPNFIQSFYTGDKLRAFRLFRKVLLLFVVYSIITCLGLRIFAEIPVGLLYGEGFTETSYVLEIFALGIPLIVLNRLSNYVLVALHLDAGFFFVTLIGLAINLILNYMWIPHYSIYGAAAATIVSECIVLVLSFCLLCLASRSKL